MKKNNKKGFTLAELLIVVAIIAVLTAIAIPVFNTQLEKSREGVDAANIRSAYAEVLAARLGSGDTNFYKLITIKQHDAGWLTTVDWPANLTRTVTEPTNAGGENFYAVYTTGEGAAVFDAATVATASAVDVDTYTGTTTTTTTP